MMFNKNPLIKWLMISAVLSCVYAMVMTVKNLPKQQNQIFASFMKDLQPRDNSTSLSEAQEGVARLKELQEKYPDPKDCFEEVKENYKVELLARLSSGIRGFGSGWEFNKKRHKELKVKSFDENNILEISFKEQGTRDIRVCLATLLSFKKYLAIKGKWDVVFFSKRISYNPDAPTEINSLDFTEKDKQYGGSRISSSDEGVVKEMAFRPNLNVYQPGLHALQFHFYPDKLMMKTADGIMKSPVYWLRVRK